MSEFSCQNQMLNTKSALKLTTLQCPCIDTGRSDTEKKQKTRKNFEGVTFSKNLLTFLYNGTASGTATSKFCFH